MILHHVTYIVNEVSGQRISFLFWEAGFCLQVWGERNQETGKEVLPPVLFGCPLFHLIPNHGHQMGFASSSPIRYSSAPWISGCAYDTTIYQFYNYLKGKSYLFGSKLGKETGTKLIIST